MRGVQDFYSLITEAHKVAAAMSHFSMPSLDSALPDVSAPTDKNALHDFMMHTVGQLVDKRTMMFTEMHDMYDPHSFNSANIVVCIHHNSCGDGPG